MTLPLLAAMWLATSPAPAEIPRAWLVTDGCAVVAFDHDLLDLTTSRLTPYPDGAQRPHRVIATASPTLVAIGFADRLLLWDCAAAALHEIRGLTPWEEAVVAADGDVLVRHPDGAWVAARTNQALETPAPNAAVTPGGGWTAWWDCDSGRCQIAWQRRSPPALAGEQAAFRRPLEGCVAAAGTERHLGFSPSGRWLWAVEQATDQRCGGTACAMQIFALDPDGVRVVHRSRACEVRAWSGASLVRLARPDGPGPFRGGWYDLAKPGATTPLALWPLPSLWRVEHEGSVALAVRRGRDAIAHIVRRGRHVTVRAPTGRILGPQELPRLFGPATD